MRPKLALLAVVLLGGLALAGTATAIQDDGSSQPLDDSINDSDDGNETKVGICVIGVDSPCNDEEWDGDDEIGDDTPQPVDGTDDGSVTPVEENRTSESIEPDTGDDNETKAGICVVGADSPCNGGDDVQISTETPNEHRSLIGSLLDMLSVLF